MNRQTFRNKPSSYRLRAAVTGHMLVLSFISVAYCLSIASEDVVKSKTKSATNLDGKDGGKAHKSSDSRTSAPQLRRPVIRGEDLEFLGAFELPRLACGSSTGYACGCLAIRHVDEKTHIFSDSHIYTGGAIYEAEVPALSQKPPFAQAKLVKEWGDIYQERKLNAAGKPYVLNENIPTNGLRWDEEAKRLWWVYGEKYNTENQAAPTFGFSTFAGGRVASHGPWKLTLSQLWQRGGTLEIPEWFADKFTEGRRLGIGFGGYYSVFEGGSFGPALAAASTPAHGKQSTHTQLLGYPEPHRCVRDANYHHADPGWMGRDPVDGKGTWNATDEIGGENYSAGAVWIDLPDRHGLLFFASLGQGRISYEDGAVRAEKRSNALYVYDPAELADVAQKRKKIWEPKPEIYPFASPAQGLKGRVAGAAFDPKTRRLYVVFAQAYADGEEFYPAVMVYAVKR